MSIGKVLHAKVFAAVLIILPFILIGDLFVMASFRFSFFEVIILLIASIVLPIVSESIGLIVNLKYPKLDFQNETEVVKQSTSSMVAVFAGIILTMISLTVLLATSFIGISVDLIILSRNSFICHNCILIT